MKRCRRKIWQPEAFVWSNWGALNKKGTQFNWQLLTHLTHCVGGTLIWHEILLTAMVFMCAKHYCYILLPRRHFQQDLFRSVYVGLMDFSPNKTPIKTCFWTNSVWNAFWLLQTWTLDSCTQHICTLHMQCTCSIGTWRDSRKPRCLPTIYHFFASQLIDYQRETGRSSLQISLTIFPTPPFDLLPVKLAGSDSLPKILFPDSEK